MKITEIRNPEETYDSKLTDIINNHDKILIIRKQGGAGDIINTRMIFEDLKNISDMNITFAIPEKYIPLVIDHPYIDNVIDYKTIKPNEYSFRRDITNKCGNYECRTMPDVDKHRSDIWANYIGLKLQHHNSHINFTRDETDFARNRIKTDKLKIGIAPVSSHLSKDWALDKWQELIAKIKAEYDCEIFCFHDKPVGLKGVIEETDLNWRQWMACVNECDVVMTVATSMFALANALHKPTVAMFGGEDLDIYGRHFPELIPIQRHKKHKDGWNHCPCWNSWSECKMVGKSYYGNEKTLPLCLKDIKISEVWEGFKLCLKNLEQTTVNNPPPKRDGFAMTEAIKS